ncbi:hypothetical protein JXA32_05045 [Candidatus Sumerlaeota bacterium]|nr:hypothetical protein [Candidatus Sumerlaeota bacterium]
MEPKVLEILGQVAGVGGIVLGTFLLLFKDLLEKMASSKLGPEQFYKLIRLMLILTWSVAMAGLVAWAVAHHVAPPPGNSNSSRPISARGIGGTNDNPRKLDGSDTSLECKGRPVQAQVTGLFYHANGSPTTFWVYRNEKDIGLQHNVTAVAQMSPLSFSVVDDYPPKGTNTYSLYVAGTDKANLVNVQNVQLRVVEH